VLPVEEEDGVKSVGHSMTLQRDVATRDEILRYLLQLSEMVGRRARRYGVTAKTVSLSIRFADFYSSVQRQTTVVSPISLSDEIFKVATSLLDSIELHQAVRLLGVSLSNLQHNQQQLSLFEEERRKSEATRAMDAVNDRFGDYSVTFGSLLQSEEKGSHVISPAWRPEGIRNVGVE